ncbi:FAD-dependent oxidoreductase [Enemella sp. A6]|uniref:FAD-dependent oxidoreductase n=1 Tax=Enemella sp. A6 TaxID=3440152 RepID=UPI003EBC05DA
MKNYVIVGGVAGGMSAATRLRRLDEQANIIVFERTDYVSFANCGLPYYVGGVITERDALLLQTPESLNRRFGLDVRVGHEVVAIDRAAQSVRVRELATGEEFDESYDALVLSTGAAPVTPPIPGIERALRLRDIADVDKMAAAANAVPSSAVVIGAGFIGLEVAENLSFRDIPTTVVEMADQVLTPLDPEMAAPVADELRRHGIEVLTGAGVSEITDTEVVLDDGRRLPAELVVASIGVRPDSHLAAEAGLELNDRGGIIVDEQQRTSDPLIFAVGDAATKRDAIDDSQVLVPLAQTANRHGRLVADVLTGRDTASMPVLGTAIVKVFDLTAASTGWNEKRLREAGRNYRAIHTHPSDHAGYYPGAQQMSLKLLIGADTDLILGAQGVGPSGVDKRIDVIATAIRGGITASGLADLELAYAPPFGSAKDPINMLGMIADNLAHGYADSIQWHELAEAQQAGAVVIDVRTPGEFARGAIPGAINIEVDALRERFDEIPSGELIVHCQVGLRGHTAARLLEGLGRPARNLDGGYKTWAAGCR